METSKIGIFESISLQSKIMPYYGSPPEGFLLLSLLSKSVRGYLLEHYPQYRRFMFEYAKEIKYDRKDEHLEMKLPLDLFKFSELKVDSEEAAELLVCLIRTLSNFNYLEERVLLVLYCNLTNKEGLYFGEHYMSDQILIGKIYVQPEYIGNLIKYYIEFKIKFK